MKHKRIKAIITVNEQLGCFGDYNRANPMCTRQCVLRLRCAIQQDQNMRLEMLEDLVAFEGVDIKIQ